MDGAVRLFGHLATLGIISLGFASLNGLLTLAVVALAHRSPDDDDDIALVSVLAKDVLTIYTYAALVALATVAFLGASSDPVDAAGGVLLGVLIIVGAVGGAIERRRKRAAARRRAVRPRMTGRMREFQPLLLAFGPSVFVACLLLPALALPTILGPILSVIGWLADPPLLAWIMALLAVGFACLVLAHSPSAAAMLTAMAVGAVRAGRTPGVRVGAAGRVQADGRTQGPRDDAGHVRRRFELLRTGSVVERIEARRRLAAAFEHRGMFGAATDLLISNVNDGDRDAETYTRLAHLYRSRGQAVLASLAAREAAKRRGTTPPRHPPVRTAMPATDQPG